MAPFFIMHSFFYRPSQYPALAISVALLLTFHSLFSLALIPMWAWLIYASRRATAANQVNFSGGIWLMALYLTWVTVSPYLSLSPYMSWQTGMILGALPVAYLAWRTTPNPERVWRHLELLFFPLAWALALTGLVQVYSGTHPRALGWGVDPNVYAAVVNLLWFPLYANFMGRRSQGKPITDRMSLLQLITLFVLSMAFSAATSRGALLSWLAAFFLSLWIFRRHPQRTASLLAVIAVSALAYGIVELTAHLQTFGRLEQASSGSDASVTLRFVLWQTTLKMFLAHPLLGTGLGTWHAIYPAFRPNADNSTFGYYAHNDYLQLLQETGIIGAAVFVIMLGYMGFLILRGCKLGRHQPNNAEAAGLALAVLTACLQANVNFIFYLVYINLFLGLYLGRIASVLEPSPGDRRFDIRIPRLSRVLLPVALFIPLGQLFVNLATETLLNGNSSTMAWMEKTLPSWGPYQTAAFITAIRPNEYIAERYLAESQANALEKNPDLPPRLQATLLKDTVHKYERLRKLMIDPPALCEQETALLLQFRALLPDEQAAALAHKVVAQCLRANPRDPRNYIAQAKLVALEKGAKAAEASLSAGNKKMLFLRDSLILKAEWLKYQRPDQKRSLSEIQRQLFLIKAGCPIGQCTDNTELTDALAMQLNRY